MNESFKHATKFNNGQLVQHVLNSDETGIITEIRIRPNNFVYYVVIWADSLMESTHTELELKLTEKVQV